MAKLLGKFKMQEWKVLDKTDPSSDYPLEEQKNYLEGEYRTCLGQGWLFKWIEEESDKLHLVEG